MMRVYAFLAAVVAAGNCNCFAFTVTAPLAFRGLGVNHQAASTMNPMARTASQSRGMQMAVMDEDSERALANMARAARKIGPNDRVVELRKPMGLVLEEDEKGNVYVVEIYPNGSASRSKNIFVGDKIAFVSATFGDEIWSAKGVGLSRVQSAIKGSLVKLVLESTKEGEIKRKRDADKLKKKKEEKESSEEKRNRLLNELKDDTQKQKKKGWYGLF